MRDTPVERQGEGEDKTKSNSVFTGSFAPTSFGVSSVGSSAVSTADSSAGSSAGEVKTLTLEQIELIVENIVDLLLAGRTQEPEREAGRSSGFAEQLTPLQVSRVLCKPL